MNKPSQSASFRRIEDDLILACVANGDTDVKKNNLRRQTNECQDWGYLIKTAAAHGVVPLVCSSLDANAADLVPKEALQILQRYFKANAENNFLLVQELILLIQEFRVHGIEAIPFKGPSLAITAYRNVALRTFVDLDILVKKNDFSRARELLAARGYMQPAGQTGTPTESYFESQLGCDQIRADGRMAVELHWTFIQKWLGFRINMDSIWIQPRRTKVGQVEMLILPEDINLLYLCVHGAKHHWSRLCWIVDVAKVLKANPEWDWDGVMALAKKTGSLRTFFIGLSLVDNLLGIPIPENVKTLIKQDKKAVSLARVLSKKLFAVKESSPDHWFQWKSDFFHLSTKERWREKLVYLRYLVIWFCLPSDKDRQWIRLPRWLGWLYIFLRPIRVAWQSIPAVV